MSGGGSRHSHSHDNRGRLKEDVGYVTENSGRPRSRSPVRDRGADRGYYHKNTGVQQEALRLLDVHAVPPVVPEDFNKAKFTGRCRLFVGNLPRELKEDELKQMFSTYGEIGECYISEKGFGFVTMDTRVNADAAKQGLDGNVVKGRTIRVRFAQHNAVLKVKEIPLYVSNELLYQAFSIFGDVERAVHFVDDKGRPTGEGLVEFARRPGAADALRKIGEGVFLLTASPRPLLVEPVEQRDEEDGLTERMIPRNMNFAKEREVGPRFAPHGSFEFDYGQRWKELYREEKRRREQLDREFAEARDRLEQQMELAHEEYQAELLREDLRRRQEELDMLEEQRRQRLEKLRRLDGERNRGHFDRLQPGTEMPFGAGGGHPSHEFGGGGGMQPFFSQGSGDPMRGDHIRGDPMRGNQPGAPGDESLVHGVQKLLQMFKKDPEGEPSSRFMQQANPMMTGYPPAIPPQHGQGSQMEPDLFAPGGMNMGGQDAMFPPHSGFRGHGGSRPDERNKQRRRH